MNSTVAIKKAPKAIDPIWYLKTRYVDLDTGRWQFSWEKYHKQADEAIINLQISDITLKIHKNTKVQYHKRPLWLNFFKYILLLLC
jgi:hypothetical protein